MEGRTGSRPLRPLPSASGPWRSDARRNLLRKDTGASLGDPATPRTSWIRRYSSPVRYPVSRFRASPVRPATESRVGGAKSVEPSSPEAIEVCARPTPLTLDQSFSPGQRLPQFPLRPYTGRDVRAQAGSSRWLRWLSEGRRGTARSRPSRRSSSGRSRLFRRPWAAAPPDVARAGSSRAALSISQL